MSKTPKTQSVPAPQFVIFDPPLEGYEARAEVRNAVAGETVLLGNTPCKWEINSKDARIVLTPVKRIEDLLPVCKVECWASQDESGQWFAHRGMPPQEIREWGYNGAGFEIASRHFNPFCLPVEHNADWKSQLYHFTPAQGWKKVGGK